LEAHHSIIRCSRHKRDRRLLAADRAQVSRWNLRTDQKFQNFKPPVIRISGIARRGSQLLACYAEMGLLAPSNSNA
jgi:hypothetical protein